jgi:hypothetical protein
MFWGDEKCIKFVILKTEGKRKDWRSELTWRILLKQKNTIRRCGLDYIFSK